MPKPSKKKAASSSSSDSDSGPEDRNPPAKKAKTDNSSKGDETSWDLGKRRFAKLCEFKGKWFLDIREFYDAGGELKPGKKGIMLTMEQWQKLKSQVDSIDEAIKRNV